MVSEVKTKSEPYVRFRGFTDEWEQVKLGKVAKVVMGQSPKSENYTDDDSFPILVQGNADIDNGVVSPRVWTKQVTKLVDADTILLSVRAPVGDVALSQYDVVIGRGMAGIVGNSFIYQKLIRMNDTSFWRRYTTGSTFESINSTDVKNALILTPSLDEQQAIGELFQTVDSAINLSNTQVKNLKQQKKALLQRLFPQKGETAPKVRLRGFTDAWEQVTLGDALDKGNKDRVDDPNDYNRLTVKLNKKGLEKFESERELANTRPFYQRFKDEIIIGKQNYFNGSIAIVTDEFDGFVSSNAIMSFSVKRDMTGVNFIYFLISQDDFIKQREHFANGTGQKELSESDFLSFKLRIPSLPEQQAIGELFQTVDEQIRLAEDKVSQYKELKQALLQRLFV